MRGNNMTQIRETSAFALLANIRTST